ncbi:MAG: hypothetical protein ACKVZJ_00690 [Phycisphaerales bacterium]
MRSRRNIVMVPVLTLMLVGSAMAADPLLIPPAPKPGPGLPNAMNPVPGQTGAPVRPAQPPSLAPPPHGGGGTPIAPIIVCPPAHVISWSPTEYVWGLGVVRVGGTSGYRIGLPYEPLEVTSRRLDPQALPARPIERPITPQERASYLLRNGLWDDAVSALSVLVSHARNRASGVLAVPPGTATGAGTVVPAVPATASTPPAPQVGTPVAAPAPAPMEPQWSVAETQRLLALALLGQKRAPQAARAVAEAYAGDPTLCDRPLSADELGSSETLRRLMLRAVTHAQQVGGTEAWFAAAVLMQAQGRTALPPNVAAQLQTHPLGKRLFAGPVPGTP